MQNDTKKQKKKAPIICAMIIICLLGIFLATILFPLIGETYGDVTEILFVLIYGLFIIAVILGVIIALRQRLQEIERGEEEDAKKY